MLPHPSWLSYAWIALRGAQAESRHARTRRRAFRRRMGNSAATPGFWFRLALRVFPSWPPEPQDWASWFALSPVAQWHRVLEAWVAQARSARLRRVRRRLLSTLKVQTVTDRKAVSPLRHLGMWHPAQGWAPWARTLLLAKRLPPTPPPAAWRWEPPFLHVPFPADWPLVEKLERLLRPLQPGLYDLRQPLQEDEWAWLQPLLEQGLGRPWTWVRPRVLPVHVGHGVLVTFASPEALDLWLTPYRRQRWAATRLSAHHLWIPASRTRNLLRALEQAGFRLLPRPPRLFPRLPLPEEGGRHIARAWLAGASLFLRYRDGSGRETRRVVTPWSMEVRGGELYLRGYDHTRQAERLFLVRRILEVRVLEPEPASR